MPYVLEYTSRHYQRRPARRRAVAAFCAGFAAAAAGFVAFVASSVRARKSNEIISAFVLPLILSRIRQALIFPDGRSPKAAAPFALAFRFVESF